MNQRLLGADHQVTGDTQGPPVTSVLSFVLGQQRGSDRNDSQQWGRKCMKRMNWGAQDWEDNAR